MIRIPRLLLAALVLSQLACGAPPLSDPVIVDGSSTLRPLTEAVAADFMKSHRGTQVTLSSSGTVDGFARFCRGELDVVDASRPVTTREQTACEAGGVTFIELPVAHDALTVIVHANNVWAASLTVSELRTLWEPAAEKRITRWNQVRPDWPDEEIALFGPGPESGTFDYFTDVVMGTADASRKDYTASADDQVIVDGVAGNPQGLGYLGYSYFDRNRARVRAVAIDDGNDSIGRGPIEPSPQAVGRGIYRPFARPLFVYVNTERLRRPEVKAFIETYLRRAGDLARGVGTVPLMATAYDLARQRLVKGVTGTMYTVPDAADRGIEFLLTQ
jgi:phosphate transport system substrate-binding protein